MLALHNENACRSRAPMGLWAAGSARASCPVRFCQAEHEPLRRMARRNGACWAFRVATMHLSCVPALVVLGPPRCSNTQHETQSTSTHHLVRTDSAHDITTVQGHSRVARLFGDPCLRIRSKLGVVQRSSQTTHRNNAQSVGLSRRDCERSRFLACPLVPRTAH